MKKVSAKIAAAGLAVGMAMGAAIATAPAAQAADVYVKYFYGANIWDSANQCQAWVNSHEVKVVESCLTWSFDPAVTSVKYQVARHVGR